MLSLSYEKLHRQPAPTVRLQIKAGFNAGTAPVKVGFETDV
jgi:hypothetical protein